MIAISAGSRSNASIPPASISATTPNGLTQLRSVTSRSGSPSPRISRPSTSTSTMSPRWTLSSIPLRTWRTRIGGTIRGDPVRRAGAPTRAARAAGWATGAGLGGRERSRSGEDTAARTGVASRRPRIGQAGREWPAERPLRGTRTSHPTGRDPTAVTLIGSDRAVTDVTTRAVSALPRAHSARRRPVPATMPATPCGPSRGRRTPEDRRCPCRRPCTSRSIRPSSTSSRSCATRRPSRRSSARSSASCRGCSATRRWPTRASGRSTIRTPIEEMEAAELGERIGLVPILRAGPRHGRRDARADADRPGLAPRPVPRRADAPPGRVLQQAARLGVGRPVPDPRPDARDRRLGDAPRSRSSSAGAPSSRSGSSWST